MLCALCLLHDVISIKYVHWVWQINSITVTPDLGVSSYPLLWEATEFSHLMHERIPSAPWLRLAYYWLEYNRSQSSFFMHIQAVMTVRDYVVLYWPALLFVNGAVRLLHFLCMCISWVAVWIVVLSDKKVISVLYRPHVHDKIPHRHTTPVPRPFVWCLYAQKSGNETNVALAKT